jgi:SAM-dependent methyltransferase
MAAVPRPCRDLSASVVYFLSVLPGPEQGNVYRAPGFCPFHGMSIESSRAFWDNVAHEYHTHLDQGRDPFQDKVNTESVLSLLPSGEYETVLDIGCGNGRFTRLLQIARPGWSVVAFDSSFVLASFAREQSAEGGARILVHDAVQPYPFPDHTFSGAVSKMVFPSLFSLETAVSETHRILNPGGFFILSTLHEAYYENHLLPNFRDWLHFFERNLKLEQMSFPDEYPPGKIDRLVDGVYRKLDENRTAVWVRIAGSGFTIPVYQHTEAEIREVMSRVGFTKKTETVAYCTEQFAATHVEWKDRVGMPVTVNTLWEKESLAEGN